MNTLFTNSGPDSVVNAFYHFGNDPCEVFLVSPFFSHDEIIKFLVDRKCNVRLIVRLGPATNPKALKAVSNLPGVKIRFFTSRLFHTKLYIFGQKAAVVGSANLTDSGLLRNREVSVVINPDDKRFDALIRLFNLYWDDAEVLTQHRLNLYENIYLTQNQKKQDPTEAEVIKVFGDTSPTGIQVGKIGKKKLSKEKVYLESYRRTYQEFLDAFKIVEERYKISGERKQPENIVPLRIEIDQFFSFIRETYTTGESYLLEPILQRSEVEKKVDRYLDEWFKQEWSYLDEHIPFHYKNITQILGSPETIDSASAEELFDALDNCHSVYDSFRFYKGGHATQKETFLKENEVSQIKRVLKYLLHDPSDHIEKFGICIYEDEFKLRHFGRSAVQEVFGWVNQRGVPICNGRTVKALRFLGFNVLVFN